MNTQWQDNYDFMGAIQLHEVPITAAMFWDGKRDALGKCVCTYQVLYKEHLLFVSDDETKELHLSPFDAPDSVSALFSLLFFISLRPGDTDDEYFRNYTKEQMAFARSYDAELLGYVVSDYDDSRYEEGVFRPAGFTYFSC